MGTIFGKYEEPKYDVLYSRMNNTEEDNNNITTPYEIRKYGKRYAVEAEYINGTSSPFPLLAGYIGVMQRPQNDGNKSIAMTTPVTMAGEGGTKIKMTAPVALQGEGGGGGCSSSDPAAVTTKKRKKMQFMLPQADEFDDISKIPKPSNPNVHIVQLQEAVGAVHKYTGTLNRTKSKEMASKLIKQLQEDGIVDIDDQNNDAMMENYQYWRYDPPMMLPWFSRNEVWIELTQEQVNKLKLISSESEEKS